MNEFERLYYESDDFWKETIQDEANKGRIERTISVVPKGIQSLVDLGCGNGVFLNSLKQQRPELELIGMDRSLSALKYVRTKTIQGDLHNLPFESGGFDCASCLEVIEHLPIAYYEKALSEIARIASQYVIISVPYKEKLEDSFNRCPKCRSTFSYEMHVRSFNDVDMEVLLKPYGFKCISKEYIGLRKRLVGHSRYRKIFYSDQFENFISPVCPICGYLNPKRSLGISNDRNDVSSRKKIVSLKQRFTSAFTFIPKLFWPKENSYYWVLCLYKRET